MTRYIIPTIPQSQTFKVQLNGIIYIFVIIWRNDPGGEGGYVLDIYDVNEVAIVRGIALVTGADLLAQYGYLEFGGTLQVETTSDPNAVPLFTTLGSDSNLFWTPNS